MINPEGFNGHKIKVSVDGEVIGEVESIKAPEQEVRKPVGVEAQCWGCGKIWNITLLPANAKGVKCSCGGYVVTETGKALTRPFYDAFDSMAPVLELDEKPEIILLDKGEATTKRIILPGEE